MMRSLYSAISGLKNHQIKMDVIGDNIANVNTVGFKRSRVTFSTMLSQTTKGASASIDEDRGGTNAIQIGLGAAIASVDRMMSQGSNQYTGEKTDMMLQGTGFFVLDNGGVEVYTRAGSFGLDTNGLLIDPATGALVMGWVPDTAAGNIDTTDALSKLTIKIGASPVKLPTVSGTTPYGYTESNYALDSYNIDQAGVITGLFTYNGPSLPSGSPNPAPLKSITAKLGQVAVATFANEGGLESVGNNFFRETNNSGDAQVGGAGKDGRAMIVPNTVEMSNVDLSQEMTDMIVTQRGFQANSRVITVSDTLLEELINLKR